MIEGEQGGDLEVVLALFPREQFLQSFFDLLCGDALSRDGDPLRIGKEMGRGEEAHFVAGELKNFSALGGDRPFSVGAGDVDRGKGLFWGAEPRAGLNKSGEITGLVLLKEKVEGRLEKILWNVSSSTQEHPRGFGDGWRHGNRSRR